MYTFNENKTELYYNKKIVAYVDSNKWLIMKGLTLYEEIDAELYLNDNGLIDIEKSGLKIIN